MARNNRSKWQAASQKMNEIRFMLEDVLDGFTPEEKSSPRYQQLVKTLEMNLEHSIEQATGHKKSKSWWTYIVLVISSPLVVELIKFLLGIGG